MFRHTKKSRRSAEARALKLRLESLEERQLLTAVGWEAVATNEQVCYGPEFRASAERCEATIDLLATTGVDFAAEEYAAIRAAYPALGLKENFADVNVIEIDSTNIGVVALKKAIEVAGTTDKDDLIVVRTTDVANTIEYSNAEDQIVFNIDSSAYGAVNIVALGTQPLTINAYGSSGVINIEVGNVGLANLFITGGFATEGCGGGVYVGSESVLVATNSTISGNGAENFEFEGNCYGGGVYVGEGATFTSTNSKIVYNEAFHMGEGDSYGGGVYVGKGATFTSTNSTIVGNKAYVSYEGDSYGGGVYVGEGATFTSTNSTIAGNSVFVELDGNGYGGGVKNSGTFNATNTILYSNLGGDLDGDVSSDENNLIGADPSFVCAPEFSWDGYLINANSLDLRLNFDSSAIDQGDDQSAYDAGLTVDSTDMVGESRFAGHAIDIGSYEYHVPLTSVSINGGVNVGETLSAKAYSESEEVESATYVWALDGNEISSDYVVSIFDVGRTLTVKATGTGDYAGTVECSQTIAASSEVVIDPTSENLVQALDVLLDGGTIKFAPSTTPQTITVESPILVDNKSFTIDGTGANVTFVGKGTHRLFEVKAGDVLNLTNVTIQNGSADYGGAIKNAGTLTLNGVTFQNNEATKNGGAIFNDFGATLTINGGSFSGNLANNGGAIANYAGENDGGSTTITSVKFEGNTAKRFGGAYFGCGTLTVDGKTSFESNDAGLKGGAIYNDVKKSDGEDSIFGVVTINGGDVLFKANSAGERGGAIQTYSTLEVKGKATFSSNRAVEYGGAIDVGDGGSATLSGDLTFSENTADFGGAIFSVGALKFESGEENQYAFTGNTASQSGGAIDALAGTLTLCGSFTFTSNEANGTYDDASESYLDKTGLGGALAIATLADNTSVNGASFKWDGNSAEKGRGNCVAFKNDCGIGAETFGFKDAADYVMFNELIEHSSVLNSLLPTSISPNAVSASITVEGVKTTFGAEGVTPQQLGLGVGTHEALVQYVDANGGTSATYVLKLTVVPGASVEVREMAIADGRGVKFDFNLTKADGGAVSVWEISWGDGSTTRSDNLSESWLAAHYYAQDGTFDVSLKVVYLDGTSETFEAFSTQKIGASVAKTEALSAVFAHVDDLFEDAFDSDVYGPAFLR